MIPEWLSFRNETRSGMNFVLHLHDRVDWFIQRHFHVRDLIFTRDQNKLAHVSREIKTRWRMFRANMFLCPVMAVSAILTSNLTIELLSWVNSKCYYVVSLWIQTLESVYMQFHEPVTISSRNEIRSVFTWYQNEMSFQNKTFIPEWLDFRLGIM